MRKGDPMTSSPAHSIPCQRVNTITPHPKVYEYVLNTSATTFAPQRFLKASFAGFLVMEKPVNNLALKNYLEIPLVETYLMVLNEVAG